MECCYRGEIDIKPELKNFLSYLIKKHLCVNEKAEGILTWIDNTNEQHENPIKRTLSHIKIILDTDNSLKAKAYLASSSLSR
jgi:hypothetical protein